MQPIVGYDSLLHLIHQMNDINNANMLLSYNASSGMQDDLTQILKPFNSFLMNPWDPLSQVEDILGWKSNVYSQFINKIPNEKNSLHSPQIYNLYLSRCARVLGLPEVSVDYLQAINTESHSMYDTVEKWKERVKVAMELDYHNTSILNEIDRFPMESIKENQRLDIQFLKGMFYAKDPTKQDEAFNWFNQVIHSDKKYFKAFEQLGKISYSRWKERGDMSDAKHCITCCVNQLCGNVDHAPVMARLLHVIFYSLENQQLSQFILNNFQSNKIPNLPVWLGYLPFLLSRPNDTQIAVFHNIIIDLSRKFPCVVFYPLLTLCQSLEKTQASPATKQNSLPVSAYAKPTTLFNGTISLKESSSKQTDVVSFEVIV